MQFEQEANDQILVCFGFILLGYVFIIATTHGLNRRSNTYKVLVAVFFVYEVTCFIFFNIIYVKALYKSKEHGLDRRIKIDDPDNPGHQIYVSPYEVSVMNEESNGTGEEKENLALNIDSRNLEPKLVHILRVVLIVLGAFI